MYRKTVKVNCVQSNNLSLPKAKPHSKLATAVLTRIVPIPIKKCLIGFSFPFCFISFHYRLHSDDNHCRYSNKFYCKGMLLVGNSKEENEIYEKSRDGWFRLYFLCEMSARYKSCKTDLTKHLQAIIGLAVRIPVLLLNRWHPLK